MANHPPQSPSNFDLPNGAPLVDAIAGQVRKVREADPFGRIAVITPSIYSAFFLKRSVTAKLCHADEAGLFNVEFMRMEEASDRLFDSWPDWSDKPPMSRLVASQLLHNAMLQLETRGPLDDQIQNDATLTAVQSTLQDLELLQVGAEYALVQLCRGSDHGLYPQLLEIHRNYRNDASAYLTREQQSTIAAATTERDHSAVASALGENIILVRPPSAPDAYTRLWNAIGNLPTTVTLSIAPNNNGSTNCDADAQNTRFYSTMSAADEPRALIRNIMSDARDGVRFGEMAVFYPSIDHASRIRDALDAAGIKNCGPATKTLGELPAGRFVALFLTMLSEDIGMRRDAFTSWTSSSPVIDPRTGERVPAVSWEITTRQANISRFSSETDWGGSLRRYATSMKRRADRAQEAAEDDYSGTNPDAYAEAAKTADNLRFFVSNLIEQVQNEHIIRWAGWVNWLNGILTEYCAPQYTDDDRAVSGLDRIEDVLQKVSELDAVTQSRVDFARFSRTIQRLLKTNVGGSSGWGSSVLVAPIAAGTGTEFKSVHVLGMAEGGLPGPGRSDPLLPDHFRRDLDPDGSTLLTKSDRLELDQKVFQMALNSAPSVRMYWNKALLGATSEAYPSPWFVNELQRVNEKTNIPVKSLMDPHSDYVESVPSLSEFGVTNHKPSSNYEFDLCDVAIRSLDSAQRAKMLADPKFDNLAAGRDVSEARRSAVFGPFDGYVEGTSINALDVWETSATALEKYAKCPYSFFLTHELKVQERIDPEESLVLSPLDKGILVHAILETFLKKYPIDRSETGRSALREIATGELDRFQKEEFVGYDSIFDLEKVRIIRDLETWHRTHLQVLDGYEGELLTEESFGSALDGLGQFQLNDGFAVQFRGKIDLIAISPDRQSALVLDFKSGSTTSYSAVEKDVTDSGTKLQLPIYSQVASEVLGHPDVQSAFWFVFQSGDTRIRPKAKVWLMDAVEEFSPVLSTLVNTIRSGAFPARQGGRSRRNNCTYCPYDTVCTSDRLIAWDRKKTDPVLEGYVNLAEDGSK